MLIPETDVVHVQRSTLNIPFLLKKISFNIGTLNGKNIFSSTQWQRGNSEGFYSCDYKTILFNIEQRTEIERQNSYEIASSGTFVTYL